MRKKKETKIPQLRENIFNIYLKIILSNKGKQKGKINENGVVAKTKPNLNNLDLKSTQIQSHTHTFICTFLLEKKKKPLKLRKINLKRMKKEEANNFLWVTHKN